jgi:hypothetical protein
LFFKRQYQILKKITLLVKHLSLHSSKAQISLTDVLMRLNQDLNLQAHNVHKLEHQEVTKYKELSELYQPDHPDREQDNQSITIKALTQDLRLYTACSRTVDKEVELHLHHKI